MKRIKLVVSDFHIGDGRYFNDGTRNILEDFQYDDQFVAFLYHYSSGEYSDMEVELVINGDFLNLLQINYKGVHTYMMSERVVVEGLRRIVHSHEETFTALRRFAAQPNHSIAYVIGNHDQGLLFENARRYFCEVIGAEVKFYDSHYEFDGIRIEHGHAHEWGSRFNPNRYFLTKGLPEPILNLPWGSIFVAEVMPKLKMERPYIDKVKPFTRMLVWMAFFDTFFGIKALFALIFFALDTLFFKLNYRFIDFNTSITNLFNDITVYPNFDWEARRVLNSNDDIHALIMGHTHVLRYRMYREGKEYYNTGTWNEATNLNIGALGTQVMLTYACIEYPEVQPDVNPETSYDRKSLRPKIKLKEWKGYWKPVIDAAV